MSGPTDYAVATVAITLTTNLVTNKPLFQIRQLVGGCVYFLVLALINDVNSEFATRFAVLVLIGAVLGNGGKMFDAIKKVTG